MKEASKKFNQTTSYNTDKSTYSPGSADGPTPCNLPGGPTNGPSGRDHAPASPSQWRENETARLTAGTFGPLFDGLSQSADLQSFLESRLRQRMAAYGSPEYDLTWKQWDMPSGVPICALRASGRRILGNGCGGWLSPSQSDGEGGIMEIRPGCAGKYKLRDEAQLAGWPSPSAQGSAGETNEDLERLGNKWRNKRTGRILQTNLATDAKMLAGWPSPVKADGERQSENYARGNPTLRGVAGWATPKTPTGGGQPERKTKGGGLRKLEDMAYGAISTSSPAATEKRGVLNPAFPRWLQAFPEAWNESIPDYEDWRRWTAFMESHSAELKETVLED